MKIEKSGIEYTVKETAAKWELSAVIGGVYVLYEVSKKDCESFEKLKEFVKNGDF